MVVRVEQVNGDSPLKPSKLRNEMAHLMRGHQCLQLWLPIVSWAG